MKRLLFAFIAILTTSIVCAQIPGTKVGNKFFTILNEGVSPDTIKINIGDTLHLGIGSYENNEFKYIADGQFAGNNWANNHVIIKFFKYLNNGRVKKIYAVVKSDLYSNYGVDLVNAIKYGEVIGVNRIKFIQNKTPTATIIQNKVSIADELKKFKELFDQGIISKEEFDAQKKKLLDQK